MTSFQAALLNEDPDSEEELLSVISHLVVCAIEDPGVPNPKTTLTILGQNLRQADITNTNLSEILRIFISARATLGLPNSSPSGDITNWPHLFFPVNLDLQPSGSTSLSERINSLLATLLTLNTSPGSTSSIEVLRMTDIYI